MYIKYIHTVDLEIFVCKIFRGNIFRVKKFSWDKGTYENFFTLRVVYECSNVSAVDVYRKACCVRGYHVYHGIWEAAIGEVPSCEQEPRNRVVGTRWR